MGHALNPPPGRSGHLRTDPEPRVGCCTGSIHDVSNCTAMYTAVLACGCRGAEHCIRAVASSRVLSIASVPWLVALQCTRITCVVGYVLLLWMPNAGYCIRFVASDIVSTTVYTRHLRCGVLLLWVPSAG
eukprot:scpid65749/ scgid11270/ 